MPQTHLEPNSSRDNPSGLGPEAARAPTPLAFDSARMPPLPSSERDVAATKLAPAAKPDVAAVHNVAEFSSRLLDGVPQEDSHRHFPFAKRALAWAMRKILSLRYDIEVKGLDRLPSGSAGFLVLPSHPALIDPVIVAATLWNRFRLRPLMNEDFYKMKGVNTVVSLIGAIPVPNLDRDGGAYRRRRVENSIHAVASALQSGENVLLYPSGQLMRSGHESLGGNSGLFTLLQKNPEIVPIMVRTEGLYGSSFSCALTGGGVPNLFGTFMRAIPTLLKNFVFFSPRRKVTIELVPMPEELKKVGSARELNRALEQFYNKDTSSAPTLVPRSIWSSRLPTVPPPSASTGEEVEIPPKLRDSVIQLIARVAKVSPEKVTPATRLGEDLGIDSLQTVDLAISLQEEVGVAELDFAELPTVGAVLNAVARKPIAVKAAAAPARWMSDRSRRTTPQVADGETIEECFLRTMDRLGSQVALADDRSGVLTGKRAKLAALTLANALSQFPEERIGIMLPGSVGTSLTFMGTRLAGKSAVMINWTAGRKNVEHAVKLTGLKTIVTSRAFLDRVQYDLGPDVDARFVFLEDLRQGIGLRGKVAAATQALLPTAALMKLRGLSGIGADSEALVLFTSGSEAAPKAVPLTHGNVLANIRAAAEAADFKKDDVLYGFLPPFHSFGITLCTVMPLVTGLKVVLHPDPNESRKLASGSGRWDVSMMAGTPAFLKGILTAGSVEQFKSLRLLICGADKLPADLPDLLKSRAPQATLVEGYGVTECAPMVTVNRPGEPSRGVGKPLRGVELRIFDPETKEVLPEGVRGLVGVRGPNVFPGYLGGASDPFVTVDGRQYYNTGDLGFIDQGSLILAGRMKRFVKIGGEMISLPAIEELLAKSWEPKDSLPEFVVIPREREGQDRVGLVLYTTRTDVTLESANEGLLKGGFTGLSKLGAITYLKEMPLLGSGKVDIQRVKSGE